MTVFSSKFVCASLLMDVVMIVLIQVKLLKKRNMESLPFRKIIQFYSREGGDNGL